MLQVHVLFTFYLKESFDLIMELHDLIINPD